MGKVALIGLEVTCASRKRHPRICRRMRRAVAVCVSLVQFRSHAGETPTNRTVTMKGPLNARAPRATTGQKALEFNLDPLLYGLKRCKI